MAWESSQAAEGIRFLTFDDGENNTVLVISLKLYSHSSYGDYLLASDFVSRSAYHYRVSITTSFKVVVSLNSLCEINPVFFPNDIEANGGFFPHYHPLIPFSLSAQ